MDKADVADANMHPGVFQSWEVSEDKRVWTLHLRPDIVDSFGKKMKAEDAKWILQRHLNVSGCQFIADSLNISRADQIRVLDDLTLRITLPEPNPIFLRVLNVDNGMPFGPTAREHATKDDPWAADWLKRNAPSIGPYKLETWEPGRQMVLVRNPNWFGEPAPIARVIYRQVPEAANRVALFSAGEAQVARELTQDQLDNIDDAQGGHAQCIAANQFVYMGLNANEGPTADPAVRRALAYAVPYEDILQSVYRGRAKRFWSLVTGSYRNVIPPEKNPYEFNLNKAKQLLAEAGYPDGFTLNVLVNGGVPEHEQAAILIRNSFSEIGVDVQIDRKPTAAFLDSAFARELEAVIDQNYAFILDVTYHANVWLLNAPPPNLNYTGWSNREFNALQKKTVTIPEGQRRDRMQVRMQEIFLKDSPWLLLVAPPTCLALRDSITGYTWHTHNDLIFSELDITE